MFTVPVINLVVKILYLLIFAAQLLAALSDMVGGGIKLVD